IRSHLWYLGFGILLGFGFRHSDFICHFVDTAEKQFESEIVVVGAGPAGLAAACAAVESGASVAVIDETTWLGGQIWRGQQREGSEGVGNPQARKWLERFHRSGVTLLERT